MYSQLGFTKHEQFAITVSGIIFNFKISTLLLKQTTPLLLPSVSSEM